jgi:hypothetical protein
MLMYSFRYVEAATAYYASDLTRGGVNVFVRNFEVCGMIVKSMSAPV